ncbi:NIPSNAP family protein [Urbifossiella limnaea]|uniref:NIPSNAP domain-containing protein n=1 Tax=Urbifossiella limnaea TaxID=2528023 RepID=A0A517XYK1_9BACT|nr:NIPSNAP family protein [Urbifossiella limnaea]QDU22548.1 hypothetical protein ETAA1_45310 [Urbifossiella limnaea]
MRLLVPVAGLTAALAMLTPPAPAQEKKATPLYEMRTYYSPPGKLDALHARFRDHTVKLFAKHGITNVGYFVPEGENKDNKLVYFISFPDKAARDASFKAFAADPAWKAAAAASEKDGKILTKIESVFLTPTDYSPVPKIEAKGNRVFELRTYTTTKGNLPGLDARFRDHTMKLFEKHGMTNVVYWHRAAGQPGAENNLTYLMAHPSKAAGLKAFDAFRMDPDWLAARKASEDKAGGSLTEATNGVLSEYLVPTDYSPLK